MTAIQRQLIMNSQTTLNTTLIQIMEVNKMGLDTTGQPSASAESDGLGCTPFVRQKFNGVHPFRETKI